MKTIQLFLFLGFMMTIPGKGQDSLSVYRTIPAGNPVQNVLLTPNPGEVVINQISPAYSGAGDEYIELLNKTGQSFDLSTLKIAYQSASGNTGSAGGNLSGTIGPYQFWLLSPNAAVTVGQTTALSRDGAITAGMASTSGQLALRLKSAPNTIIDGVAYGTITVNNLGEGTPVPSPLPLGGYARIPDGTDSNNNISDITLVQNSTIYLRNSSSLFITGNYTLPSISYTDISLSGSSPEVHLMSGTTLNGKLSVHAGTVVINPDLWLTVAGNTLIEPTEGLVLKSDATGTGSFLPGGSVTGTARAERYIPSWTTDTDGWHFLSSPVVNQSVTPGFTDPVPENYDFYRWDEPSVTWKNQKIPANNIQSFAPGEGYLVAYATTAIKHFSGTFNNSDRSFTNLSYTNSNPNYYGWHLLGNPFSCPLKWNDGSGWGLYTISGTAKLLNSGGTYTDVPPNGILPSMNGFLVQANGPVNALTIPKASRISGAYDWYKEEPGTSNRLKITVSSLENNSYAECVVQFNANATSGYDPDFDSQYLPGFKGTPQLFVPAGDNLWLSTHSISPAAANSTVKIGFKKGDAGSYKLTAAGLETFDHGTTIYLEDCKTNEINNLILNSFYIFASEAGDLSDRFRLHFGGTFSIGGAKEEDEVIIYSVGSTVNIRNLNSRRLNGVVYIHDILGRVVLVENITESFQLNFKLSESPGYYFVTVHTDRGIFKKKLLIQ